MLGFMVYRKRSEGVNIEKLFPSECFRDEEPLKMLKAIKSSKEAILAYLHENTTNMSMFCEKIRINPLLHMLFLDQDIIFYF